MNDLIDGPVLPSYPTPVNHAGVESGAESNWSLMSGRPAQPAFTRSETIKLPISSSQSSGIVAALSEVLAILSDRIAHTIYAEYRGEVNVAHSNEWTPGRAEW